MGGCLGHRGMEEGAGMFDAREIDLLRGSFTSYFERVPEARKHKAFTRECLEEIFVENPRFGSKLFTLLEFYSKHKKLVEEVELMQFLEVMVKDVAVSTSWHFRSFERFELMALASIDFETADEPSIKGLSVSYIQTLDFLKDFVKIFQCGQKDPLTDECFIRALVDGLFGNRGEMEWGVLMSAMRTLLPGLNGAIKRYFQAKFMQRPFGQPVPNLSAPSYLLKDELLFQLLLAAEDSVLTRCGRLSLVYSSLLHGEEGFEGLARRMVESKLPTLLVLQHEDQYFQVNKRSIFGAVSSQRWVDSGQANGGDSDFLFSAWPEFRILRGRRAGAKNFCYLNYCGRDGLPVGIGFGGSTDGNNCRLWVDPHLESECYCRSDDSTYEPGLLVQGYVKQLQITVLEVWGLQEREVLGLEEEEEEQERKQVGNESQDFQQPIEQVRVYGQVITRSCADYYWLGGVKTNEQTPDFYWMPQKEQPWTSKQVATPYEHIIKSAIQEIQEFEISEPKEESEEQESESGFKEAIRVARDDGEEEEEEEEEKFEKERIDEPKVVAKALRNSKTPDVEVPQFEEEEGILDKEAQYTNYRRSRERRSGRQG